MNAKNFLTSLRAVTDSIAALGAEFAESSETDRVMNRPLPIAIDEENTVMASDQFQMDLALFRAAPVAVVPLHTEFHPLQHNGHRFLLASDGLYLEVRRPWLYFLHMLAAQPIVRMPFGTVQPQVTLAFERLGRAMEHIRAFASQAREMLPNEYAELVAWNHDTKTLRRVELEITEATPDRLAYEQPTIDMDECIAIDLHSHGAAPAFFSATDNQDDAGSVKIAGVFGNLDQATPTARFRLCVLGMYLPIDVPVAQIFGE